ncbi:AI-2E family transporter [Moraxellaceae bacterium AER2_44_116]|jgi:predicted PurR-regulated permease PerM|nr:AI-2E family transporter [Moraxellaceae bacterium]TQC99172.1 AI-2E family transporter [Moraxellaceae bacterium AER2_44_116]
MPSVQALTLHRLILAVVISLLLILGYYVLEVFISPMAWAGILAYMTWPMYEHLNQRLGHRPNLSAALMTIALTLLIALPLLFFIFMLRIEAMDVYDVVAEKISQRTLILPPFLQRLPFAHELQQFLDSITQNPLIFKAQVQEWFQKGFGAAAQVAGSISKSVGEMGVVFFTLFFFYRDGLAILAQIQQALSLLIGEHVHSYVKAIGDTTRAVVYGIGLAALAQGFLAGIGYAVAGVSSPIFLGALTTLVAMIPFGTPFAWGSIAVWLLVQGHTVEAIGLAIWGTVVISSIDNVIRPLVISSSSEIPFLLVMFGVLGGLSAFGMVGLFLGPVILAVLMAVWRQWLASEQMLNKIIIEDSRESSA